MKKYLIIFILTTSMMLLSQSVKAQQPSGVTVGAIRWDAWTKTWPNNQMSYLKPDQWHYRLPFYTIIQENGDIDMSEDRQEIINREINYAARAGLDYWAFDWYEPSGNNTLKGLTSPLTMYLQSPYKNKINFALMFMNPSESGGRGNMGTAANWRTSTIPLFLTYVTQPTYQTVLNGRPLIFFFSPQRLTGYFGGASEAKDQLTYLRQQVQTHGRPNPYLVALDTVDQWPALKSIGFDALSQYLTAPAPESSLLPYATLLRYVNSYHQSLLNNNISTITTATIGVDDRPREPSHGDIVVNVADGSLAEKTQMIQNAVTFTNSHPDIDPTHNILVYAWNELSEGGWLVPGITEGDKNLRALAQGLNHSYPQPFTTDIKRQGTSFLVTITGSIPQNSTIQVYDVGSIAWGERLPITKINATTYTALLPSFAPPSQCNKAKSCIITADIFDQNGGYDAFLTFSLPKAAASSLLGDIIPNGHVDMYDYNQLISDFGKTGAHGFIPADIDQNGKVDIFDYNILVGNFGK